MPFDVSKINYKLTELPSWFRYYLVIYLLILFLLVWYVPINDFDSMNLYLPSLKLAEFGPIEQTATDVHQYIHPKTFLYLHQPLIKLGYFMTLPNFLLLLGFLSLIILKYDRFTIFYAIILTFSCQTILLGAVSVKTDITIGIVAVFGWYVIYHWLNKTWYLPIGSLFITFLVGIKWFGIPLAILLAIALIIHIIYYRRINLLAVIIFCTLIPCYWFLSGADIYINNLYSYGNLTPRLVESWGDQDISFWRNGYFFILSNLMGTFSLPAYFIDTIFHTKLTIWLSNLSDGKFVANFHSIGAPGLNINRMGILLLGVLAIDIYIIIIAKKATYAMKSAALIAITYTLIVLSQLHYGGDWHNRYFVASYIMSIIPVSDLLARIKINPWLKQLIIIHALIVSLHVLLMNQERNLIKFTLVDITKDNYPTSSYNSIFHYFPDRDALYFMGARGYLDVYKFTRDNILPSDSLLYINNGVGYEFNQSPHFVYPYIKDRSPINTRVVNTKTLYAQKHLVSYQELLGKFDYILIYEGTINHPLYKQVFNYGNNHITIYKLQNPIPLN